VNILTLRHLDSSPAPASGCDAWGAPSAPAIIEDLDTSSPFASWDNANPLAAAPRPSPEPLAPRLATWSGWLIDSDGQASIQTWTGQGWEALRSACDQLEPELDERGMSVLFRPHAAHVLSDPRSCLTFLQQRESRAFALLLDPVSLLTPEMLPDAEDHLDRIAQTLLAHPQVPAVILSDAIVSDTGQIAHAPLAEGALPRRVLDRLIDRVRSSDAAAVLLADPHAQRARLGSV